MWHQTAVIPKLLVHNSVQRKVGSNVTCLNKQIYTALLSGATWFEQKYKLGTSNSVLTQYLLELPTTPEPVL